MFPTALALPLLAPAVQVDEVDFLEDVWPILEARCIECHGPEKQKADLVLHTRAGIFGEGAEYPPVVPGKLDESDLWELVNLPADDPDIMPNEGDPLTAQQLDVIRRWIEQGAPWAEPTLATPTPDPLAIPELSEAQVAARDAALALLAEQGLHALQVAAGHPAVDVNLSLQRGAVGDVQLGLLSGLEPALVWLNLSGTGVSDEGMQVLAGFTQLRRLNLSKTALTDAGLARLAGLGELTYLNLYGTRVSDAGLVHLAGMKKLQKVFLWQTEVSDEGAERLAQALPGLVINRGVELAAPEPAPQPVNAKCPISGKDVDAAFTSEVDGKLVAFCCGNCKGQFDADPQAFVDKIPELTTATGPINEKCPVSGEPVDAAQTVSFQGKTVGFCCGKCKAAFEKDPAKFADKLGLEPPATGPINEKCPVSGEPVDAAQTVSFQGKTVGFCCGKCKAAFEKDPAKFADKLGLK